MDQGYVIEREPHLTKFDPRHDFWKHSKIPLKYFEDTSSLPDDKLFKYKIMLLIMRRHVPYSKQFVEFDYLTYKDPVRFSRDNFATMLQGFTFERNDIFFGTFRDELQRLFEGGFIKRVNFFDAYYEEVGKSSETKFLKEHERKHTEVVLSWNHLYPGFYLWLGACFVSTLVFLVEKLAFYMIEKMEKMKEKSYEILNFLNNNSQN